MKFDNVLQSIGGTPHIRFQRLFQGVAQPGQQVWIKSERSNPGGSIKDRIAPVSYTHLDVYKRQVS